MRFFMILLLGLSLSTSYAFDFKKLGKSIKKAVDKKSTEKTPTALPKVPTCDASSTNGICYEFAGKDYTNPKKAKGNKFACKMLKGKYLEKANCPKEKRLGYCLIKAKKPEMYHLSYYKKGRWSESRARRDCRDKKSGLHRHGAGKWYK